MIKVKLSGNIVTEVNTPKADVDAPDSVETGWTFDGVNWTDPQADLKTQLASYLAALDDGYADELTGIKLKTNQKAQTAFTSLVTMLQEGLSLGAITNDTPQTIWNYNDEPVVLTTLQVRQLLFRYGLHCKAFFDDYAP